MGEQLADLPRAVTAFVTAWTAYRAAERRLYGDVTLVRAGRLGKEEGDAFDACDALVNEAEAVRAALAAEPKTLDAWIAAAEQYAHDVVTPFYGPGANPTPTERAMLRGARLHFLAGALAATRRATGKE